MKKMLALLLAMTMMLSLLTGCGSTQAPAEETQTPATEAPAEEPTAEEPAQEEPAPAETDNTAPAAPKYIFLFIGDGMSYPQFQAASDYLGALADEDYLQAEPSLDDSQGAVLDGPK